MSTLNKRQYSIRDMQIVDLEQVVAIEQLSSQSPWSLKQFEQSLNDSKVLVSADKIIGFVVIASVIDEAEIHNLAVHPDYQGLGFGSLLLDDALAQLPESIRLLHLEVRASNFPAIRLYLQRDFVQMGERRDYYKTEYGREDALLMSKRVGTDKD
ncbi:ribosomal protein S18-alanine N-acetyltransferase [Porticoccaceae bacterium]|nr:ribosomal protein S18-alanine N-acetyltransferase [Porticoccaceae bacterium]